MLVMELAPEGPLHKYLKKHKYENIYCLIINITVGFNTCKLSNKGMACVLVEAI